MDKKVSELVKGYIEKADEKLKVAKELFQSKNFDDAVSRAYYAAFHAATALLLTEGLSADTHSGLVNLFGLHFVKTGKIEKKYGRFLANLKDDRESGDYEVFSTIDEAVAKNALSEAEELVAKIRQMLQTAGLLS